MHMHTRTHRHQILPFVLVLSPVTHSKAKKPAGGVSLFGGIDVLSPTQPQKPSSLFEEPEEPKSSKLPAEGAQEQPAKKERAAKDSPKVVKEPKASASLFDGEFEEEKPKAVNKPPPQATSLPPPTKKKDALFDFDDSDDDDLFSSVSSKKVMEKKTEAPPAKPSPKVEQKRTDSDILFDSPSPPPAEDDLFAAATSAKKPQQEQERASLERRKKNEGDVFGPPSTPATTPAEAKPQRQSKYAPRVQPREEEKLKEEKASPAITKKPKRDALFDDDDDDDLFSFKPKTTAPPATAKGGRTDNLFGDDGDASGRGGKSGGDLFKAGRPPREPERVVVSCVTASLGFSASMLGSHKGSVLSWRRMSVCGLLAQLKMYIKLFVK